MRRRRRKRGRGGKKREKEKRSGGQWLKKLKSAIARDNAVIANFGCVRQEERKEEGRDGANEGGKKRDYRFTNCRSVGRSVVWLKLNKRLPQLKA